MSDLDEPLSDRELEILRLVATGASNKEIASALVISPNTVKVHLRNIFTKIGVVSRTEATLFAIKHGVVAKPQSNESTPVPEDPEVEKNVFFPDSPLAQINKIQATTRPVLERKPVINRFFWIIAITALATIILIITLMLRSEKQTNTPLLPTQQRAPLPSSSRWTQEAQMPGLRFGMGTIFYNNMFFIIGGNDGKNVTSDVYQLDVSSQKWQRMAGKPTATEGARAILIGERVFMPGGKTANGQPSRILEVYDPRQNRWNQKSPLPFPLSDYASSAYEGQLYLFGGWNGSEYSNQVLIYNPQTDTWSTGSPLPSGRAFASAEVKEGKILLIGGYDGSSALTEVLIYIPSRDIPDDSPWEKGPEIPAGRYGMSSTSLANMVFLFGGKGSSDTDLPSLVLQPESKNWVEVDMPEMAMTYQGSAQSAGNFIHLFGGMLDTSPTDQHISYQAIYTISIPFTNTQ